MLESVPLLVRPFFRLVYAFRGQFRLTSVSPSFPRPLALPERCLPVPASLQYLLQAQPAFVGLTLRSHALFSPPSLSITFSSELRDVLLPPTPRRDTPARRSDQPQFLLGPRCSLPHTQRAGREKRRFKFAQL